ACTESRCRDGSDDDGDTLVDCADPDCAGVPACVESRCDDGADEDGDTLADCADPDCTSAGNCDADADGVANAVDCAPSDAGSFAVPLEVGRLDVTKPAPGSTDVLLRWSEPQSSSGSATVSDVVTGVLSELWADRGLSRASCAVRDAQGTSALRAQDPVADHDGAWFLVEAENACGASGYGSTS